MKSEAEATDDRIDGLETAQAQTAKILTRLVAVVIGDPEYKQKGALDRIDNLEKFSAEIKSTMQATVGAMRATLFIGGTVFTLLNLALTYAIFLQNAKP